MAAGRADDATTEPRPYTSWTDARKGGTSVAIDTAEQLRALRTAYHEAIQKHAEAAEVLARHGREGTQPTFVQIQREEAARVELETTRRLYFEAWMLP
jgi:hypothetical protein